MNTLKNLHENNLDYLAAKYAQEIVQALSADPKKAEISITKTLGVLQENGVYACFLYLYAREKEKKTGEKIADAALNLFKALNFPAPQNAANRDAVLSYVVEQITGDLPTLLLAKEALEQMLIYARYGAKARQKE